MTLKRLANFRLEDELLERAAGAVKEREGLSVTVQVRIASSRLVGAQRGIRQGGPQARGGAQADLSQIKQRSL